MDATMPVDTLAGNVFDIDQVLNRLKALAGLKPFLRFELELAHSRVPVALVMCGGVTLEFLACARGSRSLGVSYISRLLLEVPGRGPAERELEPGLSLAIRPGLKARLVEIRVQSSKVTEDVAQLRAGCGAELISTPQGEDPVLNLDGVRLCFGTAAGRGALPDWAQHQHMPGWHRIGLSCARLEPAVAALSEAGADVVLPPFQVLPGLRESMLRLPSGLIVQPVEQKLYKMFPVMGIKWLMAKLTGRPLRFKEKPV